MKKPLLAAFILCALISCKKSSEQQPVTAPKNNLIVNITCTVPCSVEVDTLYKGNAQPTLFDKQSNITTYTNSYNAIYGDVVYIKVFSSSGINPGIMTYSLSFKGNVFMSATEPAYTTSFTIGTAIPNY